MNAGTQRACIILFLLMVSCLGGAIHARGTGTEARADAPPGGAVTLRPIPLRDGLSPEQAAELERAIAAYEAGRGARPRSTGALPYPFFPQAGNLWQDLPVPNYVDLDATQGLLDWDCGKYTYNGHDAIDTTIVSFKAQAIGVPVFAALDGVVAEAHDGEDDMTVAPVGGERANFVILDHGHSQYSQYFHFKKGSIAVSKGETVAAGQPIGLTGSSGFSTWPHLHFASRFNGRVYEPHAGACRAGISDWVEQVPLRRDSYIVDLCFSESGFDGDQALPWDNVDHTGTLLAGDRTLHLQFEGANLPAGAALRFRLLRPDGSTAMDYPWTSVWPFISFYASSFEYEVSLDAAGPWRLLCDVDGRTVIDAPFTVVASLSEIVNHPPNAVAPVLDPPSPSAGEVLFCRVIGELYRRDPDCDLVAYRYRWTVNGAVVRDVTSAGMADALRRDLVGDGDTIECAVTPSDGTAWGPEAAVRTTVGRRHDRPLGRP